METTPLPAPAPRLTGYDKAIKVLTIIKLVVQIVFWVVTIGLTIWLVVSNPLPKLMDGVSSQMLKNFSGFGN